MEVAPRQGSLGMTDAELVARLMQSKIAVGQVPDLATCIVEAVLLQAIQQELGQ